MSIEDIKNYFHNHPVYTFSGTREELQIIVGTGFSLLTVNDKIYFSVFEESYVPTDERMELI